MAQNFLPIDGFIPRPQPFRDPMNFQVGYAREPLYLAVQSDPAGVFNNNVSVAPPTQTQIETHTYTLFDNKTAMYALIGAGIGVVLILMRPTRY